MSTSDYMKLDDQKKLLGELRARIPDFQCIPGCHDCCGPVPFSPIEWRSIKDHRNFSLESSACPYECKKGCDIYNDRPIVCRLFGTLITGKMICPHGFMPASPLSEYEADQIMALYMKLLGLEWDTNVLNQYRRKLNEDSGVSG